MWNSTCRNLLSRIWYSILTIKIDKIPIYQKVMLWPDLLDLLWLLCRWNLCSLFTTLSTCKNKDNSESTQDRWGVDNLQSKHVSRAFFCCENKEMVGGTRVQKERTSYTCTCWHLYGHWRRNSHSCHIRFGLIRCFLYTCVCTCIVAFPWT